tara:strand:- start:2691 stop:3050 length:360 start_codon:yes stop_codon:yes gene_type:complete
MSNIRIIKLTSGEDIIGDVKEQELDGNTMIVIEKPAVILMMPKTDAQGEEEFGVGLAPYAPFAKGYAVPIFANHVVSLYEPETQLLNAYNQRFGSGLVQPDFINKKVLKEVKEGNLIKK